MTHYFFPKEIKTETKSQSALFGGGGERTPVPLEPRDQRVNGIIVSYLSYYQALLPTMWCERFSNACYDKGKYISLLISNLKGKKKA